MCRRPNTGPTAPAIASLRLSVPAPHLIIGDWCSGNALYKSASFTFLSFLLPLFGAGCTLLTVGRTSEIQSMHVGLTTNELHMWHVQVRSSDLNKFRGKTTFMFPPPSSYTAHKPTHTYIQTNKQTNKQIHRQDRLQYTAPQLAIL